ncbi:hypothetical protein BGZ70_006885 [Mortierella alpina]|uniref:Uncharacterized protein n=1 Tax=Mortierella alpina TaxID=64518 RepID=A0A9P6JAM3_MORAP|nr:hypothetical protein BGZ70_006885 [Mortierella alpina]
MSQDAHGPAQDQLQQPHSQDESDPEESFPPSYEEAISHIDEHSSATNLQHQTQLSDAPNRDSSSNVHTQAYNLNDEIQNSDSDDADDDDERAYQESSTDIQTSLVISARASLTITSSTTRTILCTDTDTGTDTDTNMDTDTGTDSVMVMVMVLDTTLSTSTFLQDYLGQTQSLLHPPLYLKALLLPHPQLMRQRPQIHRRLQECRTSNI